MMKPNATLSLSLEGLGEASTICALATAPGGALGIIRVSGSHALEIVNQITAANVNTFSPNSAHFVRLTAKNAKFDETSNIVDVAMITVFRAPHSYTGEDAVEISCHGSRIY